MLLEALVLGIVVGFLRGGSLRHLSSLSFRYPSLIIGAFLLQAATTLLARFELLNPSYGFYSFLFSYLLLFTALGFNLRNLFFQIMGLGVFLNFLVILLNGGMPLLGVKPPASDPLHIVLSSKTRLKFLADIIPLKKPYPFPAIISLGDILLSSGVFLLVQEAMVYKGKRARQKRKNL